MAERERSHARPRGAVFVPRAQVMSADDVRRATSRMAHEIAERNRGLENLVLIGLQTGGVDIARRLADLLPDDVQAQRDLSVSLSKLGDLHRSAGFREDRAHAEGAVLLEEHLLHERAHSTRSGTCSGNDASEWSPPCTTVLPQWRSVPGAAGAASCAAVGIRERAADISPWPPAGIRPRRSHRRRYAPI